jgi:hypothetical protein
MKKIIKLTESDLTNIVKRVIKENSIKQNLINSIKEDGFKPTSELVGGTKNLFRLLKIDTPMDFLNLFNDMDVVQSKERPEWSLYRYKPKHNLMIYDRKTDDVYVSYYDIWSVLEDNFDLNNSDIRDLIKVWLDEVYNLRGVTPHSITLHSITLLDEVYNLKK